MKRRLFAGTIAAASMAFAASGTVYAGSSGLGSASNGQCVARWYWNPDKFHILDQDTDDNDYCYVKYGWSSTNINNRISHPQDVSYIGQYPVGTGGYRQIWWQVCKERQDDPDICSGKYNHTTG